MECERRKEMESGQIEQIEIGDNYIKFLYGDEQNEQWNSRTGYGDWWCVKAPPEDEEVTQEG